MSETMKKLSPLEIKYVHYNENPPVKDDFIGFSNYNEKIDKYNEAL